MSDESRSGTLVKPGPRIVRTWFDTVINPILRGLDTELALLGTRNWTWRFRPGDLEGIRPVRSHLDTDAKPNLDQLLEFYPELRHLFDEHDRVVGELRNAVANLHLRVRAHEAVAKLWDTALSPEALEQVGVKSAAEILGGYPSDEMLDLIAQNIVNNVGETPAYLPISRVWNAYRDRFRAIIEDHPIDEIGSQVRSIGDALSLAAAGLNSRLKDLRFSLSLEHDLPYVSRTGERSAQS